MRQERSGGGPQEPLVLFEILQTSRLADRAFAAAFASVGMPTGQFGILAAINDEPGLTQAQVARRLLVRPQSIARQIDSLIDAGLITPEKRLRQGSPTGLRISPAGVDRLNAAWPAVRAANQPERLGLSPDAADCLITTLIDLRARLQSLLDETSSAPEDPSSGNA